ncbi:hypothetical protein H2200_010741 [Cladophialophora chaetospira]|uniref:Uncharacterized protein n=1 Tax=Cladophialophora chaetospira TaxID=386627 RepID=A0AA39CDX4_9EURO|nr:hypothetical protein H2200_010741 [Cladophialophora chaetospira]
MPSQDPSSQTDSIKPYMALHDDNIRLTDGNKKLQSDYDLINLVMAVNKPKTRTIRKKYKHMMGLKLGISQTLLESRLKRARKKFSDTKAELLREYQDLQKAADEAGDTLFQIVETTIPGGGASRTEALHTGQGQGRVTTENVGSGLQVEKGANTSGALADVVQQRSNVLRPVQSMQLPDDDVLVELDGKRLTQRGLALWYQTTDMKGDNRKLFEAKNVEINQMRRVRRRK